MKKAVGFFMHFLSRVKKNFGVLKALTLFSIIILSFVLAANLMLSNKISVGYMMCLATNIRQAESSSYDIADIMNVYPVFNHDNYILEAAKSGESKDKTEKTNVVSDLNLSSVDRNETITVFSQSNLVVKQASTHQNIKIYGIEINNYSSMKDIDYEELFSLNVSLTKKSDPIFLYATHTSESYTNSSRYAFEYSGVYRTRDAKYNILSVASILSNTLIEKGVNCIFDTTPHDYTSYENSYKNSKLTLQSAIDKYSRFGIAIDLHRDAMADLTYRPVTDVSGKQTAQIMLVMGVGTKGYENPYWKENLSLAVHIMKLGEEMYPGLFKPMLIRNSKYNQDLNKGSLLVEIGATGNTLEEAYYSARCFANILNKIYK